MAGKFPCLHAEDNALEAAPCTACRRLLVPRCAAGLLSSPSIFQSGDSETACNMLEEIDVFLAQKNSDLTLLFQDKTCLKMEADHVQAGVTTAGAAEAGGARSSCLRGVQSLPRPVTPSSAGRTHNPPLSLQSHHILTHRSPWLETYNLEVIKRALFAENCSAWPKTGRVVDLTWQRWRPGGPAGGRHMMEL